MIMKNHFDHAAALGRDGRDPAVPHKRAELPRQEVTVEIHPGDYAPVGHRNTVVTDCPLASGMAVPVPFRKWEAMTTT